MDKKRIAAKFGGTSVATPERRQMVVRHIQRELDAGYQVALVVSATGRRGDPYATDTILDLVRNMGGAMDPRNYSFLFVTGEMISVALMVHTLQQAGIRALALTGGMAGIVTDDFHMSAHVLSLDNRNLCHYLEQGLVPVVCGGQGTIQTGGDFSILGRDSSDTSGVLVGVMVQAERVDIYTDVEYIHAVDPLVVEQAPIRRYISYAAACEMARFGTKVIKTGAVQTAMEHQLPVRVRSTFSQDAGTLIGAHADEWALVGLPLLASVQVAALQGQDLDDAGRMALERHVGLLRLVDASSGRIVVCAPAGDTATLVDQELAAAGVGALDWQRGYALLSLVGMANAVGEMVTQASRALGQRAIDYPYHERTPRRATFVVPEDQARTALLAVYEQLREYLETPASEGR